MTTENKTIEHLVHNLLWFSQWHWILKSLKLQAWKCQTIYIFMQKCTWVYISNFCTIYLFLYKFLNIAIYHRDPSEIRDLKKKNPVSLAYKPTRKITISKASITWEKGVYFTSSTALCCINKWAKLITIKTKQETISLPVSKNPQILKNKPCYCSKDVRPKGWDHGILLGFKCKSANEMACLLWLFHR